MSCVRQPTEPCPAVATAVSGLVTDAALAWAQICILKGSKRFILYAPWESHLISPYTTAGKSYINLDLADPFANETADPAAAARFRSAARVVAQAEQGDCLYIPAYWHHEVLSSSERETLAFSLWYPGALVATRILKHWTMVDDEHEVEALRTCVGGRFKARLARQFFGPTGEFRREHDYEWKAWLNADANRDMAVDKSELVAMQGRGGEHGATAGQLLQLWDVMLAGNRKVGKEREVKAQATPTKYSFKEGVLCASTSTNTDCSVVFCQLICSMCLRRYTDAECRVPAPSAERSSRTRRWATTYRAASSGSRKPAARPSSTPRALSSSGARRSTARWR